MTNRSNPHPLASLFAPQSIVLIGVTERSPFSASIMRTLGVYNYNGPLYLLNKRGGTVFGRAAITSLKDIPGSADVAYIMVPASTVNETLEEVASAGIRNAIVLTSGFAEAGAEGKAAQDQLVATARRHGMNLLGPNSLGFHHVRGRTVVSAVPANAPILDGGLAIVTQSGASAGDLAYFAHQENIGVSYLVHTGNEACIDLANVVDYLVADPDTKSIALFAETVRQPVLFEQAARRAVAAGKPIVILKIGASELSAQVAAAHTGSLVGDDRVFDALCHKLGIVRVKSIEDLIYTAGLLGRAKPMSKPGIGIVSISGGACTLIADQSERIGLPLPAFAPQTQQALRAVLPAYASSLNPLDVTGGVLGNPQVFESIVDIVSQDPNVGLTGVVFDVPHQAGYVNPALPAIARSFAKPTVNGVLMTVTVKALGEASREVIAALGAPYVLAGIDHGARALSNAAWWNRRVAQLRASSVDPRQAIAPATAVRPRSERETLQYLKDRGVPVIPQTLAKSRVEAIAAAKSLGGPAVLKIASADIPHKTEAGGVRLGLATAQEVGDAYDSILDSVRRYEPTARIEGVLISPLRDKQLELFVGTLRDPSWGPVIIAGLGGIWVEVLKDTVLRLLPITHLEAKEMLQSLRAASLLQGYRGLPGVDLDAAAEVIVKIGAAAIALGPELAALEVNPLGGNGSRLEALDALAVWSND
jgi:acyl-CoA synthetase (NDP forming)